MLRRGTLEPVAQIRGIARHPAQIAEIDAQHCGDAKPGQRGRQDRRAPAKQLHRRKDDKDNARRKGDGQSCKYQLAEAQLTLLFTGVTVIRCTRL